MKSILVLSLILSFNVFGKHYLKENYLGDVNGFSIEQRRTDYENAAIKNEEDIITYTWGGDTNEKAFLNAKNYQSIYPNFFNEKTEPGIVLGLRNAGRGLYSAQKITSSSQYTNERFAGLDNSGSLIEVHLMKGSRIINLSNSKQKKALKVLQKKYGYKSFTDIKYDLLTIDPKVDIMYSGTDLYWYVLKDSENINFVKFDGSNFSIKELTNKIHVSSGYRAKYILLNILKKKIDAEYPSSVEAKSFELTLDDHREIFKDLFNLAGEPDYKLTRLFKFFDVSVKKDKENNFYAVFKLPKIRGSNGKYYYLSNHSKGDDVCRLFSMESFDNATVVPNFLKKRTMEIQTFHVLEERKPSAKIWATIKCKINK